MKSVALVTAIGTITATNIVRELKKLGTFHIIGTDINEACSVATSLDVDEFFSFPPISDQGAYLEFVLNFCRKHKVDYYFAVLDSEVLLLSEHRNRFEELDTLLCVPNHKFVSTCHFKNDFSTWIERKFPEIAIRTYRTWDEIEHARFPLFRKPVEGVASTGCRRIDDKMALDAEKSTGDLNKDYILQEFFDDSIVVVDCARSKTTGQTIQVARREILRNKNGCGIAVEIIHDEDLESICKRISEELDLNGVANFEFFSTNQGYRLIEINPRFSAGSEYTCMAGFNIVKAALDIINGDSLVIGEIQYGARFAERYEVYRMR